MGDTHYTYVFDVFVNGFQELSWSRPRDFWGGFSSGCGGLSWK